MRQILITLFCILPFFGFSTPYIQKGDVIDIVAPSYGCTKADLQKIKIELTKLGYKPRVSEHIFSPTYLSYSNTNGYRFRDLKRALLAEDSKVIWVVRGGYGAQELMEDLNDMPKPSRQKTLLGFSDTTFLHLFLNQQWDWDSVHAPALKFNTEINQKVNGETSLKEITQFLENPVFVYMI